MKVALEGDVSVGVPPTTSRPASGPYTVITTINGKHIQLKGVTKYLGGDDAFEGDAFQGSAFQAEGTALVVTGSSTMKIEGFFVARQGDFLDDGDLIAGPCSPNTDIG